MIQALLAARINPDPNERCPVMNLETALMTLEEFCKDEAFPPALREAVRTILERNAKLERALIRLDALKHTIQSIVGPLL